MWYFYLKRENARRDRMDLHDEGADEMAFKDLDDSDNKHFRYVL